MVWLYLQDWSGWCIFSWPREHGKIIDLIIIDKTTFQVVESNMTFLTSYKHSRLLYAFCLGSRLLLLVVYWERISFVFKDLEICTLLSYHECLEKLHLLTLKYCRIKGDMIQKYKILHGLYDIDSSSFFDYKYSNTRSHQFSVKTKSCSTILRRNFFTIHVLNICNRLSANVAGTDTVNAFKNGLDIDCVVWKTCLMLRLIFKILIH